MPLTTSANARVLQRHSTATLAQVGTPKVTSCAEYFAQIAPWVEVDARVELFEKDRAAELLEGESRALQLRGRDEDVLVSGFAA